MTPSLPYSSYQDVRHRLLHRQELALIDVREEDPYAQAHPLFAANFPLGRIELDAWRRIPRRDTPLVLYDNGEGLTEPAARKFQQLGYTNLSLLDGGLEGWRLAGGELFRDVNVPSKAFGELVESIRHTPMLSAQEVSDLLQTNPDVVVLDTRRFDEYQSMSIPRGISVPGAELVLRARTLAPDPTTPIIVNCAGRTRSIIGTQSLVNAGIPNPVHALRNGTIGWTLAGKQLDHGAHRRFPEVSESGVEQAAPLARDVADRAGVKRAKLSDLARMRGETNRTTYCFDVRTTEEYEAGHLNGFLSAPGGQLVQETDFWAPVRGARIVLTDKEGVRANMTASWLAQMGWEVWVLDGLTGSEFCQLGKFADPLPHPERIVATLTPLQVAQRLEAGDGHSYTVLDFSSNLNYRKKHLPGAWFVLRSQLKPSLENIPTARHFIVTSEDGILARYAAADLELQTKRKVFVLSGGNQAWEAAKLPLECGDGKAASARIDRYRRPYEGTDNPIESMQAYLDWEFGLVEQLARDGTHGFTVI